MGRVRSYKKIKACDPFSKRGKKEADTVHDEPPDLYEERVKKDLKRKERAWDDENERELRLQREAKRMLAIEEEKKKVVEKKIEGKKEGESMKEFKMRIRQETRTTLRDELKGMSATSKRRKERLRERKMKRKGIATSKKGEGDEEEEGFSSAPDGRLRSSDLGGADEFAKPEVFKFGERVDRPPVFKKATMVVQKKKKEDKSDRNSSSSSSNSSSGASKQEMQEMKEKVEAAYRALREKRKQLHI